MLHKIWLLKFHSELPACLPRKVTHYICWLSCQRRIWTFSCRYVTKSWTSLLPSAATNLGSILLSSNQAYLTKTDVGLKFSLLRFLQPTTFTDITGHISSSNRILITYDLRYECTAPINLTVHGTHCGSCNLCSPLVGSSHLTNRTGERFIESYIWGSNHCIPYKIHLSGGQRGGFVKLASKLCEY